MTDKHTLPASPLPWAMCDAAPNDQWYAGRTFYSVPHGTRIGDLSPLKRHDDLAADGAYMVEACNAYPDLATRITALEAREAELVEALTLALGEAESWIHDQLDGTSSLKGALADLAPARATLAKARQSEGEG